MNETMNIYTAPGEKVVFLGRNGHTHELNDAKKILDEDVQYTVERLSVDRYASKVYLEEFPEKAFNSVMFANVSENPQTVPPDRYNSYHV